MTEPVPPPTWRDRLDLIADRVPERPAHGLTVAAVVVAVALVGWFLMRQPPDPPAEASMVPVTTGARDRGTGGTAGAEMVVHAAGAVVVPGLYTLRAGARVADLLAAAGGPAPDADLDRLNLAAPVTDGAQVFVPRVGEPVPSGTPGGSGTTATGPVDLNRATAADLEALPGVGPATAAAILAERDRRGGFRRVEDLLDVRGIGPAKFEALRDLVTV